MTAPGLTVIGAQVTAATFHTNDNHPASPSLAAGDSVQSNLSAADSQAPDFDPHVGAKPYSPFYRHATVHTNSLERLTLQAKNSSNQDYYGMQELESGGRGSHSQSLDVPKGERSKLWAGNKKKRRCLGSLSKKQRLAVKIVIAIVTVGTMIAIALGITAAVGGGVWKSQHQQGTIGKLR